MSMCTEQNNDSLIGYLYGELPDHDARACDAHLKACAECRRDLADFRAVRDDLLAWSPPECRDLPASWTAAPIVTVTPMDRMRRWMPAMGLAAAAMLLLAVSASIANLEIRYDAQGFVVRTGRGAADTQTASALANGAPAPIAASVTAEDLAALERRLTQAFAAPETRVGMQTVALTSDNPQLSREVRRLIEESERRTREEMAQRFLEIATDFEGHRRADMLRVQQVLGQMQSRTGAELAQTRDAIGRLMFASQGQQQPR